MPGAGILSLGRRGGSESPVASSPTAAADAAMWKQKLSHLTSPSRSNVSESDALIMRGGLSPDELDMRRSRADMEVFRTNCVSPTRTIPGPRHLDHLVRSQSELLMRSPSPMFKRTKSIMSTATLVPSSEPPLPEVMRFESWWTEYTADERRMHMRIEFHTASKLFRVQVQHDPPMEVSVANAASGDPLEAEDLHVGATLVLLGRKVTLRHASCDTLLWLDFHADRLTREKLRLENELSKFSFVSFSKSNHVSSFNPHYIHHHHRQSELGGTVSLRGLLKECDALSERLARYLSRTPEQE
mmetsp:Transcript_7509/g.24943  ORF Transcript_7509/g.24943 Transcript_7509/m.24943 type:complete len:300 (-) Transcript_7509:649-1548(-)